MTITLCAFLLLPMCPRWPFPLILFDNNAWLFMQFPPAPLFHPSLVQIFSSALFSELISLRSSLNVREQASCPYKTTVRTSFVYLSRFLLADRKMKGSEMSDSKHFLNLIYSIPRYVYMTPFRFLLSWQCPTHAISRHHHVWVKWVLHTQYVDTFMSCVPNFPFKATVP
jgi:hypothetical protein